MEKHDIWTFGRRLRAWAFWFATVLELKGSDVLIAVFLDCVALGGTHCEEFLPCILWVRVNSNFISLPMQESYIESSKKTIAISVQQ
jgi:hypothetical protein